MEWYGVVLTELLKRGINNNIYNYQENFDPKDADLQKPWLLMVDCGLNAKAQKVRVHPQISPTAFDGELRSICATLPDGSVVLIAANAGSADLVAHWNLKGLGRKPSLVQTWTAVAGSPEITTTKAVKEKPTITLSGDRFYQTKVPAKSMVALRISKP